jgi:hypothetical protein
MKIYTMLIYRVVKFYFFSSLITILCNGCFNDKSQCTFNYSNCILSIQDKSLFVKELTVDGREIDNPIKAKFKTDSLGKRIDLCSLVRQMAHDKISTEITITFILVKDKDEEIGKMFLLRLNLKKKYNKDSILVLKDIRY